MNISNIPFPISKCDLDEFKGKPVLIVLPKNGNSAQWFIVVEPCRTLVNPSTGKTNTVLDAVTSDGKVDLNLDKYGSEWFAFEYSDKTKDIDVSC